MLIRTPLRISFFGGGTDYPAWYRLHSGAVLATAINKYVWHETDDAGKVASRCDLPRGSGLGSSSADTVGGLHLRFRRDGIPASPMDLARVAIAYEQVIQKQCVGSQDQTIAAHGGFRLIRFSTDEFISVSEPAHFDAARLADLHAHLMLFDTGVRRHAGTIAGTYSWDRRALMRFLGMVDEAVDVLYGDAPIEDYGWLLHEAWRLKRGLSVAVSTPAIDQWYAVARHAGALGGKLCGAGGGGFLLLFVPPDRQAAVAAALPSPLTLTPFQFEPAGSQVVTVPAAPAAPAASAIIPTFRSPITP